MSLRSHINWFWGNQKKKKTILGGLDLNNDSFNRGSDLKQWRQSPVGLQKANCYVVESPCARERWIASSCWVPQHYSCKESDSVNSQWARKGNPGFRWDSSPADILLTSRWNPEHKTELSCSWTTDLQRLWDNICVLFVSIKFVIIWYSANTSAYLWNVRDR